MDNDFRCIIDSISKKILQGQSVEFDWKTYNTNYHIFCIPPTVEMGINIPSIIIVPQSDTIYRQIVLEVNNFNTNDLPEMIMNGGTLGKRLIDITKENNAPIVIPLLPAMAESGIYF